MRHGSLFSGIGGFDLAAEWMGWENVFHCELNSFGRKVLNHYWPNAISYENIKETDFAEWRGAVDIISGGFPCQPYSQAGKRLGKEDDRHLWPEMLRAIREVAPAWVVGENVRGLVNWSGGLVFDEVQADLEAIGYEVQPFLLPAYGVNAPHRRDRTWFVAHARYNGHQQGFREDRCKAKKNETEEQREEWDNKNREWIRDNIKRNDDAGDAADNKRKRSSRKEHGETESGQHTQTHKRNGWQDFPTKPPICSGNDGFSSRLDGITFPKWRNESIKAYGNAVVPQVVYQIFKAIEEFNKL